MTFISKMTAAALVALAAPISAGAQTGEGTSALRTGLKGRVIDLRTSGVDPRRDTAGRVDAGYYRLKFVPTAITEATVCPRRAFRTDAEFKRWRSLENDIFQQIFDKKGIWSITARVVVHVDGADRAAKEIRLVAIENPEERNCKIKLAGGEPGDLATLDAASVLVPFSYRNAIYPDTIQVALGTAYKLEANGERLDQLWAGIKLFATAASAGLGPIVGAITPMGKTETAKLLMDDITSSAPIFFEGTPDTGMRANKSFVYLGFPPYGATTPTPLAGGMTIGLDYQASLFRAGQYYDPANPITAQSVLSATPIPSTDAAAPGLRTVRQALGNAIYDALWNATTPAGFDSACAIARPALQGLGMSDVDADTYLWAVAATSPQNGVKNKLYALTCFGSDERLNLAKMGISIPPESIPPPPTRIATLDETHKAMTNLGGILQGATAAPDAAPNSDLTGRFAERINLIIVDEAAATLMQQPQQGGVRPRDEVLKLLAQHFSNIGCFAPREGKIDLMLPLRPRFLELPVNGRGAAAFALSREATPRTFILSFGFAPVLEPGPAKVDTILLGRRGADNGEVVQELTVGRTTASCTEVG